jgi:hypothetical protein
MPQIYVDSRIGDLPIEPQRVVREIAQCINEFDQQDQVGNGSPEGKIVGFKGNTWRRRDGGAGTCLYVFEGVNGAKTGWVGK